MSPPPQFGNRRRNEFVSCLCCQCVSLEQVTNSNDPMMRCKSCPLPANETDDARLDNVRGTIFALAEDEVPNRHAQKLIDVTMTARQYFWCIPTRMVFFFSRCNWYRRSRKNQLVSRSGLPLPVVALPV